MFKIITKASKHMCSLSAFITSLQHNKISNFFVMKYNLPTNLQLLFCFLWKHGGNMFAIIHFYVNLSTNSYMTVTLVFSICIYTVIALLNNCPMHFEFPSDAWLKMNAREEIIFKGEISVFSTKIFENYEYNCL